MPKISELPAATTPLAGTEKVIVVQDGTTKQVDASEVGGVTAPSAGVVTSNGSDFSSAGLGTAGQVLRTNSGATDVEWSTFAGAGVVNVMDYYEVADGGASYNLGGVAVTTKNVANAFDRAYDDKIATGQAYTLWLPPAADYGVTCYSWKESLTWDVSESGDNIQAFEIVGSGQASIIIPDNSAANDDKLYIAGAGPDCLSMLFAYRRMFWMGDEDDTNDCASVLRTSVDMDVLIDECTFYSVQSNSATSGVINLDTMGATMRRTYFHGCSNSGADGAVVYVGTGCFGVRFEHVQFYPWERTPRNPLGGTNYDKGQIQAKYHVRIAGGSSLDTATRFTADQCTFAENGTYGGVLAHPGANLVDTIHLRQCVTYSNIIRSLECRANVRHAIVDQCQFKHNNGGQATIEMAAATCERLTVRGTEIGSGLSVNANTGQVLVEILGSEGGTYDVSGATHFVLDAASTLAGLSSSTAAPAARVPETSIVKNDATDLTLTATQYARDMLNVTGTPGGAFNVIGPNAARTRFTVLNQTASAATIKISGGTGITVAGSRAAQVYHNGTDYIRLTADSVLT